MTTKLIYGINFWSQGLFLVFPIILSFKLIKLLLMDKLVANFCLKVGSSKFYFNTPLYDITSKYNLKSNCNKITN